RRVRGRPHGRLPRPPRRVLDEPPLRQTTSECLSGRLRTLRLLRGTRHGISSLRPRVLRRPLTVKVKGMSGEALLVFDDGLTAYDFGRGHPMSPIRVELTIKLARELGVLDQLKIVPAPTADDALLETVHTAEYVAAVKHA